MTLHVLQAFNEPEIAARVRLVLAGAAGAGVLVLIASAAQPRHVSPRAVLLPAARSGFAYLVLGLGSRLLIQHHRSRLQIALLLGAVAIVEIVRYRRERAGTPRVASWLAGSAAVCLGVVAAKWALEPGALSDTLSRLRPTGGNA